MDMFDPLDYECIDKVDSWIVDDDTEGEEGELMVKLKPSEDSDVGTSQTTTLGGSFLLYTLQNQSLYFVLFTSYSFCFLYWTFIYFFVLGGAENNAPNDGDDVDVENFGDMGLNMEDLSFLDEDYVPNEGADGGH